MFRFVFDPKFDEPAAIFNIWARSTRGGRCTLAAAWEAVQSECPRSTVTSSRHPRPQARRCDLSPGAWPGHNMPVWGEDITGWPALQSHYGPATDHRSTPKSLIPKVFIYIYITMLQINKYISRYPHTHIHAHTYTHIHTRTYIEIYFSGKTRNTVTHLFLLYFMRNRADMCYGNRRKNHNGFPSRTRKCKKSAQGGLFT
jgi:hypothetical protein